MRKVALTVVSIFGIFFAGAQTTPGEKIMTQIADLYNREVYKEMFQMHSPDLQAKIPEDKLTAFYAHNVRQPYGKILSWEKAESKNETINYAVQMENGPLDLSFRLNDKNEITSIQWLPKRSTAKIKKRDISTIRSNNPKQTKLQLLIDSLALDHLQNAANCGLSIGIINGDKTEMYFYGSTNKKAAQLPDAETMYEIGSVTKTFTGIILARAINEGKIKADDDIRKYMPGEYPNLQYKGSPIKIVNLANHTSRLPRIPGDLDKQPHYNVQDPYKNYSRDMMYDYLKTVTIDTLPGTICEYSNLGMALLGVILEDVYHRPLEELVKKYITGPAKMTDTKFELTDNEKARMATGYFSEGGEARNWNLAAFNACGGLKSDLADMMKYAAVNMQESNEDIRLSHRQTYTDISMSLGLNWIITTTQNGDTLIWHNGATAGYTSFCGFIKEKKAGVVILNNSGAEVDNIALNILKGMSADK